MRLKSDIDPSVVEAYKETHYHVLGKASMTLQVGVANLSLAKLHKRFQVDCSAFITACNAHDESLDDAANARRLDELSGEFRRKGLTFYDGVGQHPSGNWPGEASFLVLGMTLDGAKKLGNRYGQNAVIWCGADAVPQLILLR